MKYSNNFNRDYEWYLSHSDIFTFDGSKPKDIVYDPLGKTSKECFYIYDTQGKLLPTKEPIELSKIFKCKGSINFQIKEWAQDRAKGYLPKIIFNDIIEEYKLLDWIVLAVEKQKYKYYDK